VRVDAARSQEVGLIGEVTRDVEPNCPDGSARYLSGTVVTLTPQVLQEGAVFSSWNSDPRSDERPPGGATGPVPQSARAFTITADTTVVAGFYYGLVCSPLTVYGDRSLVSVASPVYSDTGSGCGNGYYFDELKYRLAQPGQTATAEDLRKYRTTLFLTFDTSRPLPPYVSIRGDVSNCFGRNVTTSTGDWTPFGIGRGTVRCDVTGPIIINVEACQALEINPQVHVIGEPADVRHTWAVPQTIYVPDDTGRILGLDTSEFHFVEALGTGMQGGNLVYQDIPLGACHDNGVLPPDTDVALMAMSPSGFAFEGWGETPPGEPQTAVVLRTTTDDAPTMTATPLYEVACHTVTLDAGMHLEGEPARCPGSSPEDNSYVAGTAVQVRAQYEYNGRKLVTFLSGVINKQIYEDPVTLDLIGYAYVDRDRHVQGDYPSSGESLGRGIVQGLKLSSGIFAIAAPIVFGMMFPPAGILFSVMGAGAGLASLAGLDEVAAGFDLLYPTKITACAARWAFSTTGDPTGAYNPGAIAGTTNKIVQILQGKDVLTPTISGAGFGAGAAGFVAGLYSAQVWNADFDPQTVEQLRDTDTMTGCLDEQWRAANSNLTGPSERQG
jgi:hypothetical protein